MTIVMIECSGDSASLPYNYQRRDVYSTISDLDLPLASARAKTN